MLGKTPVALQTLSNSYDKLKKDTDLFLKKFKKFKKLNPDVKESENVSALSEECKSLANELESLTKEINLLENKDPKQQKNFDSKKKSLLKKVATQQKLVSDTYDVIVQQTTPEESEVSRKVESTKDRDTGEKAAAKRITTKKKQKEISEKQNRSKKENNNNSSKRDSQSGSTISGKSIAGDSEKEINEDISENVDECDESNDDDDDDEDDGDNEEDDNDEEEEEGAASTSATASTSGPASSTSVAVTEDEDVGKVKSFKSSHSSSKSKSKILNQKSKSEKSPTQVVPTPDPHEGQAAAATTTESESSVTNQKKKGLKSKLIADMKSVLKHNLHHKEKLPSKTKELLEEEDEGKKEEKDEGKKEEEEESDEEEVEEESDEEEAEEELSKVDEEKEDSTNEEDDDEEEEEEESDEEMELPTKYFIALSNYEKEETSDLSFKKGEVLKIVQAHRNGWWLAENNDGFQGLVPSTYLQMRSPTDDEEEEEEDSAEESRKDEGESDSDDNSEEEEKENEEEEDSDIDEDVKVESGGDKPKTRSAKQLWQTIKESIQEQSIVDVLQAKGTVPSGFRPSTLSSLWAANSEYRMEKALHPSLSKTAMSYTDLFYSPSDKQICPYSVNILKIVSIQSCRNIPQTGPGIDVQCRCIRVCIFDGKNVLSNIHTIKVQSVDKSQKSWNFSSRVSDNMDVSLHTEFFVRTNYSGNQINLLFELCLSYTQQDTQEQGIFSCGWTKLLLSEETMTNRTYELPLHGGTPYDRGIPLDSRFSNAVEENSFLSLFTGHQKPTLVVKVFPPKKEQKDVLNSLPHTIIGNVCLMHFYALYRNILAKALLRDRIDSDNTELISSSVLASFPLVADQFDMMQLLRDTWIEKQKERSRTARRDSNTHKKMFIDSFLETVYPFSHILTPGVPTTGIDTSQRQYDAIRKFKDLKSERGSTLAVLLSDDFTYEPMKLSEVTFSVLKDNEFISEA
ncbi:nephrocystin-1 [Octopus bimaculoides]|uniref:SH3 domain-containing protein n=1 Tax=Octopus bimaculoides TaxID=37653 RepID=A0A0L8GLE3_OCTBM|nr:nephrocystin-1 [Octopus bimaculoides]|eukprot:XP_014779915.1 PREDICTED: nephrocystin-1-like [Octopus bimaculoides]